ncbi:MAG: hypothetical protein ACI8XG_002261 [Congregibacter sp.]|jgi:hypothetical protein
MLLSNYDLDPAIEGSISLILILKSQKTPRILILNVDTGQYTRTRNIYANVQTQQPIF